MLHKRLTRVCCINFVNEIYFERKFYVIIVHNYHIFNYLINIINDMSEMRNAMSSIDIHTIKIQTCST